MSGINTSTETLLKERSMKKLTAALMFTLLATPAFAADVVTLKTKQVVPYNVVEVDEENSLLQLAVPAYSKQEFEIKMKDNVLTVTGNPTKDNRSFFKKSFTHKYLVDKGASVGKISLSDGILSFALSKPLPANLKTRNLNIE